MQISLFTLFNVVNPTQPPYRANDKSEHGSLFPDVQSVKYAAANYRD